MAQQIHSKMSIPKMNLLSFYSTLLMLGILAVEFFMILVLCPV